MGKAGLVKTGNVNCRMLLPLMLGMLLFALMAAASDTPRPRRQIRRLRHYPAPVFSGPGRTGLPMKPAS